MHMRCEFQPQSSKRLANMESKTSRTKILPLLEHALGVKNKKIKTVIKA